MKKLIVLSTALFMMFGVTAFAGPPKGNAKPAKVEAVKHQKKSKHTVRPKKDDRGTQPSHGNKKGWFKNTHNPHNPNSNNPGHAQGHMH